MQEISQTGKMRPGNLFGSGKLAQKGGNGGDMQTGNQFFLYTKLCYH